MKNFFYIIITALILVSCGIEDYPYIYSIPTGNVQNELNNRVSVYIPNDNSGNLYFTNYTMFYRIYISDNDFPSPAVSNFSEINTSLYNDYLRVLPYIGNDSMGSSSIASIFASLNYYSLSLEGQDIDYILSNESSNSIFGKYMVIDFSTDNIPYLTIGNGPKYNLLRYNGGGHYAPKPDNNLYFLNTSALLDDTNISDPSINNDITDKPGSDRKYTYVSIFIVATGLDPQTFIQLYSSPTHIGVLKLPDTF